MAEGPVGSGLPHRGKLTIGKHPLATWLRAWAL